jgi:hypothetical protein
MSKWLQRLYYWWVIGDWRLAKQQQEIRAMTKQGGT